MEVGRKSYLASIVPVIVNAILSEHQIVVDIVAFVNKGDFPRSRLGEKQRGKILASWVTRKMRTMAQFGIRDADSGVSDAADTMEPRSSVRNSSAMGSSLRNVEPAPQIIEERVDEREADWQQTEAQDSYIPHPIGISEMPAQSYDNSTVGSLTAAASMQSDDASTHNFKAGFERPNTEFVVPGFGTPDPPEQAPPRVPKPAIQRQSVILPAVEGREGDLWSLPSQQPRGGLRVQNASSDEDDEDSWTNDAIMHMNLAAG